MSDCIGSTAYKHEKGPGPKSTRTEKRQLEISEWSLLSLALVVTLLLTVGIFSFAFTEPSRTNDFLLFPLGPSMRGLAGLILLFDMYVAYQQLRLRRIRRRLNEQEQLFQLIGQHAADMIAVVDMGGKRLYNSPAYEKILGYSATELQATGCFEQVHPDDRQRVINAAEEARRSGVGRMLQYRMRRKDGSWRTLESSASVVRDAKGQPDKLVIVNRDITDRKSMEEQITNLRWAATHDSLTGLPNRLLCEDHLQGAIARATRHNRQFALLCIDVDKFKMINDEKGHDAGDVVLKQLATRLQSGLRAADMVARFGGDEFIAILEEINCPEDVQRIAMYVLATASQPVILDGSESRISISIGAAIFPEDGKTSDALKRNADYAMYRAKANGGNTYEMSSDQVQAGWEHSFESCLQKAVHGDGLEIHYQPQYTAKGQLAGLEALLRLRDPQLQHIAPVEFIALAEQNGLIVPIGEWVLRESCRQAKAWEAEGFTPVRIAVNVSTVQLACRDFAARVETILNETGLAPSLLELELTESVLMADIEDSARSLRRLEQLGVRIAIDDFGTGYSSLTYLHRLPVHSLKIEKSFVQQIDASTSSLPIIRSIVTLGRSLGLQVIAEGVETDRQSAALTEAGCDLLQGYLYCRPKPACNVRELLSRTDDSEDGWPVAIKPMSSQTAELRFN